MNRITTIVLFAGIFAVTVGTLGIGGISATPLMVSAAPQSQEGMGMLGHVEYKVFDESGNVKAYMQNDNVVVEGGKDCAAKALFNSAATVGQCTAAVTNFQYIGIGNGTSGTVNVANQTLADATDNAVGTCAASGVGGEMARKSVTPTFDVAGTTTIVTLDTSSNPFKFTASNATSVKDSGVFNNEYDGGPVTGHICPVATAQDAGTDWTMFSRQLLNGATGITVANGDSLSVKWTITVG
ncbi:MAG TPA: hypothetical protein VLE02_05300 [Nitrosarchaeum sp.]|nr:hypothetical protein [Nitrosarchaeum sp.]